MRNLADAIQEFEDNAYHHSLHPNISEESKVIALKALLLVQKRENGCEYCNDGKLFGTDCNDVKIRIKKIKRYGSDEVNYCLIVDDAVLQVINECPICRRDLT